VPGVFSPVELDGLLLVDGGLVNPIPIAPTLTDSTDLTIAVNLSGMTESYHPTTVKKKSLDSSDDEGYRRSISQFISKLIDNDENDESDTDAADLLVKSIDVMQGAIARLKLAAYTPDKVIDIPRDACSFFEFNRAEEMADLGYEKAVKALDDLGLDAAP
jgi:NTE family protein